MPTPSFLEASDTSFESFFLERKQIDSNSCGAWLVSGICSHLLNLPEIADREHAFAICYSLLERESKATQPSMHTERFPDSYHEKQQKKFSTAKFLINALTDSPKKSKYFREIPPKGIRTNFFYTVNSAMPLSSLADINADDNGAYLKFRITIKPYYYGKDQINTVHQINDEYYYNKRETYKSYSKVTVSADNVVSLHRTYGKPKSFPFTRTIIKMSNPNNGPPSPYVAVLYQAEHLPHGNAIEHEKPYFRTSKDVLEKTKENLSKGMPPKKVYDRINDDSGGAIFSISQSNELRDTRQVYRQSENLRKKRKEDQINDHQGELASIIQFQRREKEFVRNVSCICDSFYVFLGATIQLSDVAKFCCDMDEVLCIDTTFNLCEYWLTDTCYGNLRLETKEGKNPIFIGPSIMHFARDEFLFNWFISKMCSFQPKIRSLKTIGTDQDKAIYNGFLSNTGIKFVIVRSSFRKGRQE